MTKSRRLAPAKTSPASMILLLLALKFIPQRPVLVYIYEESQTDPTATLTRDFESNYQGSRFESTRLSGALLARTIWILNVLALRTRTTP